MSAEQSAHRLRIHVSREDAAYPLLQQCTSEPERRSMLKALVNAGAMAVLYGQTAQPSSSQPSKVEEIDSWVARPAAAADQDLSILANVMADLSF